MRLPSLLGCLVFAACATAPVRENDLARCRGHRIAIVSNDWRETVDVYGSGSRIIGTVRPRGREEFVLPDNVARVYATPTPHSRYGRVPRNSVRIRYQCR
jgi:hypothetical protein